MNGEQEVAGRPAGSGRLYAYWGVALGLLIALALLSWLVVVPVWRTHAAARRAHDHSGWERREIDSLGGPERAVKQLGFYMRLPQWLASHRYTAARMLGRCGERAIPELVGIVNGGDELGSGWAVMALGDIGEPALEPLVATLRHEYWGTRWNAARVLGNLKGPRAEKALEAALSDKDSAVRRAAREALEQIREKGPAAPPSPKTGGGDP